MVNEELLSETVRKYTVLYDKSSADFKDRYPSCNLYQGVVCTFFEFMKMMTQIQKTIEF